MSGPRVRFAPSPTGFFHVGSARSALFNWFLARQSPDGVFILRIEDTDESRNREEWVDGIVEAMAWLGMHADEGPYRQSDFLDEHLAAIESLRLAGRLYYCDCTGEDVAARKAPGEPPGYDGFCRTRSLARGERTALRFAVPDHGSTTVPDLIRGDVIFENSVLDDFVVAKSSGTPLFFIANVVDDRRDQITHVVRGEEHLPNTPRQILLWRALDEVAGTVIPLPRYAHLPVLVNEQRKKLSKRRDPVAVELYREQGFLAVAITNYLSLLGWSPRSGDEKVPQSTCIAEFQLSDVSHSPAFFDVAKLSHLNGEYIREMSVDEFINACGPWVAPWGISWTPGERTPPWNSERFDARRFEAIAPHIQTRVATLSEVPGMVDFLFLDDPDMDDAAFEKTIGRDETARELLRRLVAAFEDVEWTAAELHTLVVDVGAELDLNLRKAQAPLRCAITGRLIGPPLFEALEILGRTESIRRVNGALTRALS